MKPTKRFTTISKMPVKNLDKVLKAVNDMPEKEIDDIEISGSTPEMIENF